MPCTCNAICDNDCSVNQLCTGHVPVCVNTYGFSWTPVAGTTIIRSAHLTELQDAINQERTNISRRFTASNPAYCSTHTPGDVACSSNDFPAASLHGKLPTDIIDHDEYDDVKNANNDVTTTSGYGGLVTANFVAQGGILAANMIELQTKIDSTRTVCICDSHCNCDPSDCGCNGECPSDDYYYYYP